MSLSVEHPSDELLWGSSVGVIARKGVSDSIIWRIPSNYLPLWAELSKEIKWFVKFINPL